MAHGRSLPVIAAPAAADPRFIEMPGLLIVRLMSRCNNRCIFCMVEDEIQTSNDVDYAEAVNVILRQPPGTKIEFFGGEPTIYPRFLDLLRIARERGHPCSLATHGRTFAASHFTDKVAALGREHIYIRTSLYGDTAELHDFYTAVPRSFRQTVDGIRNIVRAGFRCQVNVVIMARNYDRLCEMTRAVHSWGVPRIKFSNLISVESCPEQVVSLARVRPELTRAIALAENLGLTVTIEKTPICVAAGRMDLISTERQIGLWSREFDDGECGGCLVRRWCDGVDPGYRVQLGFEGLERMTRVPRAAVKGTPAEVGDPEFLKLHCVEIADDDRDEATLHRLTALLEVVESRLGLLAIIPRRFIKAEGR